MLFAAHKAHAHDFEVNGIYYGISIFNKNTAYVTHKGTDYNEAKEYAGSVVIPESVTYNGKTYPVASIGGYAFAGCDELTSVVIPSSITTINQNAFNGCTGLQSVECKSATPPVCKENVFSGVSTQNVRLIVPAESESRYKSADTWKNFKWGVSIGDTKEIEGIRYKVIEETAVEVIAGSVKYTGDIAIPSEITIDENRFTVTRIGENAFNGCTGLTSIVISNTVNSIGNTAFYGCTGLTSVTSHNPTPPTCGIGVFNEVDTQNILLTVPAESVSLYKSADTWKDFKYPVSVGDTKEVGGITYRVISETDVEVIAGTSKYTGDIIIPKGLTIDSKNYVVTKIGENAFNGCTGLTSIVIPNTVSSIGNTAFYGCTGLTSVTSQNPTPPTCGTDVFGNVNTQNIPLTVPAESISLYKFADTWKDFKYPVSVGDTKEVGGITYRVISETDVEVIAGTSKYTGDIIIPKGLTIDSKNYVVTKIGENAFNGCTGLTSIVIPNTVSSIVNTAFYGCTGLTSVTSQNPTPPTCGTGVFGNVNTQNIPLTVPVESLSLYKSADTWKNFKYPVSVGDTKEVGGITYKLISETAVEVIAGTSKYTGDITIPSEVTIDGNKFTVSRIGEKAFYECTGLTSVVIPNSVTTIGSYAYSCTGLTSVTIPNGVISIGHFAFYSCSGLASIAIPNSVTTIGNVAFGNTSWYNKQPNGILYLDNCCLGYKGDKPTETLSLKEGTRVVAGMAFSSCTGLTNITIPNSVTNIGTYAFSGCSGLTSVTSLNPVPPICESYVFSNLNTQNILLTVPTESVSLYKSADTWKDFGSINGVSGGGNETPTEPTLEEVWVHDFAGIGTNVRSVACMPNGEVAISNINYSSAIAGTGKVEFYNMNGKMAKEYDVATWLEENEIGTTNSENVFYPYILGSGIAVDGVGNIVVNIGFPNAASSTNFVAIAPNGTMTHIECTVPEPGQAARADLIDVTGDIFGYNAYIGLAPNGKNYVIIYNIFEGWNDTDYSYIVNTDAGLSSVSNDTKVLWAKKTFSDDVENAPEFYVYNRSQSGIRYSDGTPETDMVVMEGDNISQGMASNMGATAFEVNGNTYIVMPTPDSTGARANAFKIVNVTTGEVEVTSQGVAGFDTNYMQDFGASVNNDGTVNIVQLVTSKYLAMYLFTPGKASSISLGAPMSDVEEVHVEDVDAPVEYYNLQGVRVENPSHGLYIKRQGGHTTKVVL